LTPWGWADWSEESIRIDSSEYFLGLRLNMFVAITLTVIGVVWFVLAQLRPERPVTVLPPGPPEASGAVAAHPDEIAPVQACETPAAVPAEGEAAEPGTARSDD
jgi:hypothetical protein